MTKHNNQKHVKSRRRLIKGLAALGLASILSVVLIDWERGTASTPPPARLRGLPHYASEDEAKPFPETLDPGLFSTRHVSHAYRVAKEIPGVLAQQPCYCECRSYGHRSLLSCFESNHAAGCDVCIREALLAERRTKEGKTPAEIREAIVQGAWRTEFLS